MNLELIIWITAICANLLTIIVWVVTIQSLRARQKNLEQQVISVKKEFYNSSFETVLGDKKIGLDHKEFLDLFAAMNEKRWTANLRQRIDLLSDIFKKSAYIDIKIYKIISWELERLDKRLDLISK